MNGEKWRAERPARGVRAEAGGRGAMGFGRPRLSRLQREARPRLSRLQARRAAQTVGEAADMFAPVKRAAREE